MTRIVVDGFFLISQSCPQPLIWLSLGPFQCISGSNDLSTSGLSYCIKVIQEHSHPANVCFFLSLKETRKENGLTECVSKATSKCNLSDKTRKRLGDVGRVESCVSRRPGLGVSEVGTWKRKG